MTHVVPWKKGAGVQNTGQSCNSQTEALNLLYRTWADVKPDSKCSEHLKKCLHLYELCIAKRSLKSLAVWYKCSM